MINALTRIKYVPLAYKHASLHMSAILMTLMSLNMYHMLGTRLPQQIFCNVYRRCINRTQSACKQATPCLYTSFFLQAEGQDVAGCEQQETYLLYVNNMTSITQVMITRLPVAQRVFNTHSLREDDSHSETSSDSTEGNSHSENDNLLYSQFYDDLSEYLGIEPEDRQSKSKKHKLPTAVAGFSSVRYNVTDANN